MPSPVGHALGGMLFGLVAARLVGLTRAGVPRRIRASPPDAAESAAAPRGRPGASARTAGPDSGTSAPPSESHRRVVVPGRGLIGLAVLGMAADLDLLVGAHNAQSHSLGAAVLVGAAAAALLLWRRRGAGARVALRFGAVAAVAYGSHVLLDWLDSDTTPPIGVMALWPLDRDYYQSAWSLFLAISRRYDRPGFWRHNLVAVAREVALLGSLYLLVWWWLSGVRGTRRMGFGDSGRAARP
jgi:membrane-bound metal-dependent hydrolase YbcI (DUF457 family)